MARLESAVGALLIPPPFSSSEQFNARNKKKNDRELATIAALEAEKKKASA